MWEARKCSFSIKYTRHLGFMIAMQSHAIISIYERGIIVKISIITICYNSAETIQDTIESIIPQLDENTEYLIIDGQSTDGTLDIVKQYADKVRLISEKDDGISDAFNKGIRNATGDLIGIINSDDELLPHALDYVREAYEEGVDVIFGNGYSWAPDLGRFVSNSDPDLSKLHKYMSILHPATFVTKKAYEKYGMFDTSLRCVMDRDLLLRMYTGGANFRYIDKRLALYRLGGMSGKNALKYTFPENELISRRFGMGKAAAKLLTWKLIINYLVSSFLDRHRGLDTFIRKLLGKQRSWVE